MCQGFGHFSGFLHHFILAKLSTSSKMVIDRKYISLPTMHQSHDTQKLCVIVAGPMSKQHGGSSTETISWSSLVMWLWTRNVWTAKTHPRSSCWLTLFHPVHQDGIGNMHRNKLHANFSQCRSIIVQYTFYDEGAIELLSQIKESCKLGCNSISISSASFS